MTKILKQWNFFTFNLSSNGCYQKIITNLINHDRRYLNLRLEIYSEYHKPKLTSGFSSKDSFCFKLSIANLSAIGVPGGRRVLGTVAGVWCRFLVKWVPSEEGLAEPALGGSFTCSKCFPFFFVAPLAADGERALALEDHPFQRQIKVTFSIKVQLSILERSS